MTLRSRLALLLLTSGIALLWSPMASAQASIGIGEVSGPRSERVQADLERALAAENVETTAWSEVRATADALEADLETSDGYRQVAAELGLAGLVGGRMRERNDEWRLDIWVRNGRDGEIVEDTRYTGDSSGSASRRMRRELWGDFSAIIDGLIDEEIQPAVAAPEAEPTPEPSPTAASVAVEVQPDAAADRSESSGARGGGGAEEAVIRREARGSVGRRPSPFDAAVGMGVLSRDFSYNDDLFQELRRYQLDAAPAVGGEINWYPGAHFTDGAAAHIGLNLNGALAFLLDSADASGAEFPTRYYAYGVGIRGRIPLGPHELAPVAGLGWQTFAIDAPDAEATPLVPDVDYSYARFGAEARFAIGSKVSIGLRASYLLGLSAGEIQNDEWFPNASYDGIDTRAEVGYEIVENLETRLEFGWRRFGFSMDPVLGVGQVAGGAIDQYFSGGLTIAYHVPGTAGRPEVAAAVPVRDAEPDRREPLAGPVAVPSVVPEVEEPMATVAETESLQEPATHCGWSAATPPEGVSDEAWSGARCMGREDAGGEWSACFSRRAYTDMAGRGCPGEERCCLGTESGAR